MLREGGSDGGGGGERENGKIILNKEKRQKSEYLSIYIYCKKLKQDRI